MKDIHQLKINVHPVFEQPNVNTLTRNLPETL